MSVTTQVTSAAKRATPIGGRFSPFAIFTWLLLGLVALLVLYPLVTTVARTFFVDGGFNTKAFQDVLKEPGLLSVFGNTALLVVGSGILSLCIGSAFSWLNERTDARIGGVTDVLPLIPLLVPPIAGVTGWVVLFEPRIGLVNNVIRRGLGGLGIDLPSGPLNIYTFSGLIFVTALYLIPYTYLIVSAALRNFDPALEEASRINGAGPWKTLRSVTLPAVGPSLVAAGILTLIAAITMFSVPLIIGTGARIDVLSVRIYRFFSVFPPRTDTALVLSMFMLLLVQGALLLQGAIAPAGQHSTIGGRGFRASRVELGGWRWPARAAIFFYLLLTAILPVLGLLLVSGQRFWTPDVQWDKLTLANYEFVLFRNRLTSQALLTSLGLGAAGATVGMLAASVLMLFVQRARGTARRLIDAVTALPATIPHTVMGVSFLYAFSRPPVRLYGTLFILFLAYLAMYLPQAARAASSAASDVGRELSEASHVFGASSGRTFIRILLPLALPGLLAGWVILFVHMVGEITASALLSGTSNLVVGIVLLDLWENGSFPQLAAMAIVMTVLDSAIVLAMLRFTRGRFESRVR